MGTPLIALGSTTTKLISKIGPYLELVNYFFWSALCNSIVVVTRKNSLYTSCSLSWAIAAIILVIVLIKASKILKNLSSRIIIFVLSSLSFFYIGLQIYGIKNNSYYDPITSFIQKEEIINFVTVDTTKNLYAEINNSRKTCNGRFICRLVCCM